MDLELIKQTLEKAEKQDKKIYLVANGIKFAPNSFSLLPNNIIHLFDRRGESLIALSEISSLTIEGENGER